MKNKKEIAHTPSENRFSFQKGYSQVMIKDTKEVKQEIMGVLNIKTRMAWYVRLKGKIVPKVTEHEAIESIFNRYGITDIWG